MKIFTYADAYYLHLTVIFMNISVPMGICMYLYSFLRLNLAGFIMRNG